MSQRVELTQHALRWARKLSSQEQQEAHAIVAALSAGPRPDVTPLTRCAGLKRAKRRRGTVRVIFSEDDGVVLIRSIDTRATAYRNLGALDTGACARTVTWDEIEALERNAPPHTLAYDDNDDVRYEWRGRDDRAWARFLYCDYKYTPLLTNEQRDAFFDAITHHASRRSSIHAIQAGPGTGKTVAAILAASCGLTTVRNSHVFLVLPENLVSEIVHYPALADAPDEAAHRLFVGTFEQLLDRLITPSCLRAGRDAERATLAARVGRSDVTDADVVLYQASTLDSRNTSPKNSLAAAYRHRAAALRTDPRPWQQALRPARCRWDAATDATARLPQVTLDCGPVFILVDEVQDLLHAEFSFLVALQQHLAAHTNCTLWLFGDLNQRIEPTLFDWSWLNMVSPAARVCEGVSRPFRTNYRNTGAIVAFANVFAGIAKEAAQRLHVRHPEPGANPNDCHEVGDKVRVFAVPTRDAADAFLRRLERPATERTRYFIEAAAQTVKVLWPGADHCAAPAESLVYLDARAAKGTETDACVTYRLFEGSGAPSLDECLRWYTALTRARYGLLVLATPEEIDRVGHARFSDCQWLSAERGDEAAQFIREVTGAIDLRRDPGEVERLLLQACRHGRPYWDSDEVLACYGIPPRNWVLNAMTELSAAGQDAVARELADVPEEYPFVRVLLHCALGHLAAVESEAMRTAPPVRLAALECVALVMERKRRPYDAARYRVAHGIAGWPADYPLREVGADPAPLEDALVTHILQFAKTL